MKGEDKESFYCQWHITDRCNLACKHCYQNAVQHYSDIEYEKLKLIADELERACEKWQVNLEVAVTGGEPFSRERDLFCLLEYLDKKEVVSRIDILSNGLLLTDEILDHLERISKLNCVQISLESPRREIHDEIRGTGSFDKAITAIRLLKKHGIKVGVMMTLSKLNYKDVRDMYGMLSELEVDYFGVDRFIPEEEDVFNFNKNALSKSELKEAIEVVGDLFLKNKGKKPMLFPYRPIFCLLEGEEFGGSCSAGGSTLTILPDGDVLPCRRLPINLGNILKDGIFKIWYTSDVLWKLRGNQHLNSKCQKCEHLSKCRGCRGMAYAVTGDYLGEDVLCWKG